MSKVDSCSSAKDFKTPLLKGTTSSVSYGLSQSPNWDFIHKYNKYAT